MNAIRACFRSLTPQALFSRTVVIGVALELLVVQLASPFTVGSPVLRATLQLVSVASIFAALWVVQRALRARVSEEALRWVLVISLPIVASGGGAVLGLMFRATGVDDDSLLLLRTFSTCMHVTAMTMLLWTAVSSVRLHYVRVQALTDEQERLEALEHQVQHQLMSLDAKETDAVRSRIAADLSSARSENATDAIALLTATIENVVRPLSRQLESQAEPWSAPPLAVPRDARIDWRSVSKAAMSPELVNPAGVLLVLSLIATPMNLSRSGWLFHLEFIGVVTLVALPIFHLLRRAATQRADRAGARVSAFIVMTLVTGTAIAVALLPFTIDGEQPWRFFSLGPVFTLIVASAWSFAVAAKRQAVASEEALRETTDELTWRIARARETHRQRRRALAHAVHGEVQAAIAAGILQLDAAIKADAAAPALVLGVQDRVLAVVSGLDLQHSDVDCLDGVLRKLRAAWSGVAEITLEADADAQLRVEADELLMVTLNDVLPELIYNSIRHGGAREIEIGLASGDDRTVIVAVADDGCASLMASAFGSTSASGSASASGMGTRLLNDCAIHWSRHRVNDRTVTSLTLPVRDAALVPSL